MITQGPDGPVEREAYSREYWDEHADDQDLREQLGDEALDDPENWS